MTAKKTERTIDEIVAFAQPRLDQIDALRWELGDFLANTRISEEEWQELADRLGRSEDSLKSFMIVANQNPPETRTFKFGVYRELAKLTSNDPVTKARPVQFRQQFLSAQDPDSTSVGEAERAVFQEKMRRKDITSGIRTGSSRDVYRDTAAPKGGSDVTATLEIHQSEDWGELVVGGLDKGSMEALEYSSLTGKFHVKFKIAS